MKVAFDTNILVYAAKLVGLSEQWKADACRRLAANLLSSSAPPILPTQVLLEFVEVATRKFKLHPTDVAARARTLAQGYDLRPSSPAAVDDALLLVERHGFRIFDAVIVATAAEAGCDVLLSEDMHDGFAWGRLMITNPLRPNPDPAIAPFLAP